MKTFLAKICSFFLFFAVFSLFVPSSLYASGSTSSITVINLVRSNAQGHEKDNLFKSLQAQWEITNDAHIPATWLVQYSVLENNKMVDFMKTKMHGQEFGLLFEIDKNFAEKSGVTYKNQGGPWYFSDSLLLPSYDVSERRRMIDTAFAKFKDTFGYYPKTVGAWWIGADSLTYMHQRYGVIAALRAADQYKLDEYTIWGGPWDIPYIASTTNEGMPAKSVQDSSGVVILQWGARDALLGYSDQLYGVQDFPNRGYDSGYVNFMASVFLKAPFGNLVFGLENGGDLAVFSEYYKLMLTKAQEIHSTQHVALSFAGDFAKKFLQQGNVLGGASVVLAKGYRSSDQAAWVNKEKYRVFIQKIGNKVHLVDVRNYASKNEEDFAVLPNVNPMLLIQEPALIDSKQISGQERLLCNCSESLHLSQKGSVLELFSGKTKIAEFTDDGFRITVGKMQSFVFNKQFQLSIPLALFLLYAVYFLILLKRSSFKKALLEMLVLVVPLLFALSYVKDQSVFLFDTKELPLFSLAPVLRFLTITQILIVFKLVPFIILFLLHYFFGKTRKIVYYLYVFILTALYVHVWYFPLNGSTIRYVVLLLFGMLLFMTLGLVIFYVKVRSIRKTIIASVCCLGALSLITGAIFVSRTSYAITTFEMQALQKVKSEKKTVIFVNQADYTLVPIYRSVKPLIYTYPYLGQKLTGVSWQQVVRPESQVLRLTIDYKNKIIFIPRYLRTDLSEYEIRTLMLKLIFDNNQIALYERK